MTTNTNPALATRGSAIGFSFEANGSADNNRSAHATQANRRHAEPIAPAGGTEPTRDPEWWRREAARLGSDWSRVIALHAAAVKSWRVHHDPDCADMPIIACPICGAMPCASPSFCVACGDADQRKAHGERPRHLDASLWNERPARVPHDWDSMTLDALGRLFTSQRPTPQPTIEAVMHCVRESGQKALREPANLDRLRRCDEIARAQINQRIARLIERNGSAS